MKKIIQVLLVLSIGIAVLGNIPVRAAGVEPLFLLGQNEKAEVVFPSEKATPLELGKNPIQVLTGSNGQKLILCGGQVEKSGEIKQGASLRLMAQDLKTYAKTIQWDSVLTAYTINNDSSTIWLATQGGSVKKNVIKPKIYQVNLDSLTVTEAVLDSTPCEIALSGDGKWLAVASLGEEEKPTSVLNIFEADTLKPITSVDIAKNPGILSFSDDNNTLVVAGYGYQENENVSGNGNKVFTIPTKHFMKLKKSTPAGINIINLTSLESRQFELGVLNEEFIAGANTTIYSILKEDSKGAVIAIDPTGLLWEKEFDYIPKYVQERPGSGQVFIISGKRISIIDKQSGNMVKDITAISEIQAFYFLDNSTYAYAYNMSKLKLSVMNLDNLEVEKTMAAGSAGKAAFKVVLAVASVVDHANSLKPQYVNGVQMPINVRPIYWAHAPKGNMVASPVQEKLYMLNSSLAEIYTYDMQKSIVAKKLGYLGEKTLYLQLAPNGKYVILVAGDNWKLVNTTTDKADLTFSPGGLDVGFAFQAVTAPTPYFSPDGNTMYIPNGSKVMVIDLENGKKLATLESKTKNAMVYW